MIVLSALLASWFGGTAAFGGSYEKAAKEVSRMAERAGKKRVAVLPLAAADGGIQDGVALSERLMARLVEGGRLDIIERGLLDKVLAEQGLEHKGLVDPRQATQLGRVLGVDAIVTGTCFSLADGRLEANIRLIDAVTARVLGVSTLQVPREWPEPFGSASPSFDFSVPAPPSLEPAPSPWSSLRDAPAESSGCSEWEERIDSVQSSVLTLKARYWAARMRGKDFSAGRLIRNPGSEIRSLEKRQEFYRLVRDLYESGGPGGVSPEEAAQLERADRTAELLALRCDR